MRSPCTASFPALLGLLVPALVYAVDMGNHDENSDLWDMRPIVTITKSTTFCSLCVTINTTMLPDTTTSTVFWTSSMPVSATEAASTGMVEETSSMTSTDSIVLTLTSTFPTTTNIDQATPTLITPPMYSAPMDTATYVPGPSKVSDSAYTPMDTSIGAPDPTDQPDPVSTPQWATPQGNPGGDGDIVTSATSTSTGGYGYPPQTLITSVTSSSAASETFPGGATDVPQPTVCPSANSRDVGNFTLAFDDIHFKAPPPLKSPYRRFWFSPGFFLHPSPPSPFSASSGSHLVSFTARELLGGNTSVEVPKDTGAISVGSKMPQMCMRFNFYTISLGCQSSGGPCDFKLTARRVRREGWGEGTVAEQRFSTPACIDPDGCELVPIWLDDSFTNLTSLWVSGKVANRTVIWWADDIGLGWADNTCEATDCRATVPSKETRGKGRGSRIVGVTRSASLF
ncbi:uncharacterized protein MKZ38_007754 [Zalerion maritima]|uniref:DUF7371 domain-containing protein n=1 Tax=Zalerion maritima TaxID=339359 RepID=A0AAD5RWG8_9PEZI|nr:uncharacterized protein MKZ38_007754 [Zalerion maritima]